MGGVRGGPPYVHDEIDLRAGIEERHRQAKCFRDLTAFRPTDCGLVVHQEVFPLLAYTLIQVFLEMWEELLPRGDKISVYELGEKPGVPPARAARRRIASWAPPVPRSPRRRPFTVYLGG